MKPHRVTILASAALLGVAANLPADQSRGEVSSGPSHASTMVPRPQTPPPPSKTAARPATPPRSLRRSPPRLSRAELPRGIEICSERPLPLAQARHMGRKIAALHLASSRPRREARPRRNASLDSARSRRHGMAIMPNTSWPLYAPRRGVAGGCSNSSAEYTFGDRVHLSVERGSGGLALVELTVGPARHACGSTKIDLALKGLAPTALLTTRAQCGLSRVAPTRCPLLHPHLHLALPAGSRHLGHRRERPSRPAPRAPS